MNDTKNEKSKRKAGRPILEPGLKQIQSQVRFQPWLLAWLNNQEQTKSELIKNAVINHYKLFTLEKTDKKIDRFSNWLHEKSDDEVSEIIDKFIINKY